MAVASKHNAETIRQALRGAQSDIDALRDRIAQLQDERNSLEVAPRARADVERYVDDWIARAVATQPFRLGALWSVHTPQFEAEQVFERSFQANAFAMMAAWDAKKLKALLLADAPAGMSADARAAEMSRLEREIEVAEIAEEVACREIEDELGSTIMRRADVNPAILLAPTSELTGRRK